MKVIESITEAIGNTPLVRLNRLTKLLGLRGSILAKIEFFNPGLSKKDRAAKGIIEAAEKGGYLKPGQTVVELTSGNMGTGLAIVCSTKGYPFLAVMSRGNSIERSRMMQALGAEVIIVDQDPSSTLGMVSGKDLELVNKVTNEIVVARKAFRADQFYHDGNYLSHYTGTGREIIQQTSGNIDAFVDFLGSGGTFAGVTKSLKEYRADIACFIVEPKGAAAIAGEQVTSSNHPIQGGGYSMQHLKFLEGVTFDGYLTVSGQESIAMARLVAKHEGIFGGFSGGANIAAAVQLLQNQFSGKTVVACIPDSGLKYLSTDLWE